MDHQEYNLLDHFKLYLKSLMLHPSCYPVPFYPRNKSKIFVWLSKFEDLDQLKISFSDNLGEIHVSTIVILYSRGVCVRNFKSVVFRLVRAWGPNKQADRMADTKLCD